MDLVLQFNVGLFHLFVDDFHGDILNITMLSVEKNGVIKVNFFQIVACFLGELFDEAGQDEIEQNTQSCVTGYHDVHFLFILVPLV